MDINLRLLRYFLVVANSLSFSRASENLHIAQSTLSQQIKQLEALYGVDLFARSGKTISLTAEGLALQKSASQLLTEHDTMYKQLLSIKKGET
jgi:DNA-binding transcriptional LysR family regulator